MPAFGHNSRPTFLASVQFLNCKYYLKIFLCIKYQHKFIATSRTTSMTLSFMARHLQRKKTVLTFRPLVLKSSVTLFNVRLSTGFDCSLSKYVESLKQDFISEYPQHVGRHF